MDPVSAAGLAIGVASIGLQVYTGCVQGIQLLITAINFPEDCRYLNLRLRMEQQRLFAWSETSGLLDLHAQDSKKVLESNTFVLHRQTVLDLLVQVQCLFKEFQAQQTRNQRLQTTLDPDQDYDKPEKDAAAANFLLSSRRRDFIKKAMRSLKESSQEAVTRLRWVSFDKAAFELLLSKFSALNDSMTDILDARMQTEIHHTVQDTNRGVLQLHHKIADLGRLVMALNVKLDSVGPAPTSLSAAQRARNASGLQTLSGLAKFKAFNESIGAANGKLDAFDIVTAATLGLNRAPEHADLCINKSNIRFNPGQQSDELRCDALLTMPDGSVKKVWIEWKEYDRQKPGDPSPPKTVIWERVRKLAALLNHQPKPDAFRTPHCLGFFDMAGAEAEVDGDDDDVANMKLGLVFERPNDEELDPARPPISLHELVQAGPAPNLTDRIKLAHAISNCLLYLHAVNWLHKGLRSHNILFFCTKDGHVQYAKPYLSGFDFARPARPDEMTDIPGDDAEYDLYRHPHAQSTNPGERERFKKSFDIYSLGVVLVEIAYWEPLHRRLHKSLNEVRGRPSIALRVRQNLLAESEMAGIGARMGQVYQEAVHKCVSGGQLLGLCEVDDESKDVVAARLSMFFYENVTRPLGGIHV